jgi:hypothetical protein
MISNLPKGVPMLGGMRCTIIILLVALANLFAARETQAQRHGQRSDHAIPAAPAQRPAHIVAPSPAQARFKDLAVNSTFFFLSDTNRAYPWVKISNTTARNTVNTNVATISAQTPIAH